MLVDEKPVGKVQIPQTVAVRFSLDETFGVGADTEPRLEDHADRMPIKFVGTLKLGRRQELPLCVDERSDIDSLGNSRFGSILPVRQAVGERPYLREGDCWSR